MINLGDEVKCSITGFKGIAIGLTEYIYGCKRVGVQPRVDKDGKHAECQWFDEPQLQVLKKNKIENGSSKTGGPLPSVPRKVNNPK